MANWSNSSGGVLMVSECYLVYVLWNLIVVEVPKSVCLNYCAIDTIFKGDCSVHSENTMKSSTFWVQHYCKPVC